MIKRSTKLFKEFFESEKSGGLILIACTILSLLLANASFGESYLHLWEREIGGMSLEMWINDGLMAVFFLLIGIELKREFQSGELNSWQKATLPAFSALGGMFVPAAIYLIINWGQDSVHGFGIPMATDIAFALGALSLLGDRVPLSLKIFLTALAVIDDLGAILVIAIFYSKGIVVLNLLAAIGIFLSLLALNKLKINSLWIYIPAGILMWYFMHHSGVHATITGVLVAFAIPSDSDKKGFNPSDYLQSKLHHPVPYVILPLFALANTAIVLKGSWDELLMQSTSLGILGGLVLGKSFGIFLFSWLSIKMKLSSKPTGISWGQLFGVGILGGIGFTMSIFVTLLAFEDPAHINAAKFSILIASTAAGIIGILWLKTAFRKKA